ncbi:hypothetical protein [Mucilaginibacter sp.]|uniref:hypothetical protein n=1 Tax=Mucilaginibacter sp. TaxID=1882438 RepID=UPI00284D397A|nr:hypothetical protein [Mucilaginibacter sp.]MDR3696195.1 hypothetical protein [Mucilaginibacter sp.]
MPIDFANVFSTLKNGVIDLAKKDLHNYLDAATKDGQAWLESLKNDLFTWTAELNNGSLTADGFADMVAGQKEVLEMAALKEAGLAEVEADQFKSDLLDLITNTVTGLL